MTLHERLRSAWRTDVGMGMVEVMVAIAILAIVSTSALYFSLRANSASSYQQHNQVAVTLASEAMELVAGSPSGVNPATGVSALYTGRGKTAVQTAWTTNAAVRGVSATSAVWDPTAANAGTGSIPLVASDTLSGTQYTTTTLIGKCFRPRTADANCLKTKPAAGVSVEQIRVIVVVRWLADDECPGGCTYQTSSMIDVNSDLEWQI